MRLGPELGQRASALALREQRGDGEAERCRPKVRWAAARHWAAQEIGERGGPRGIERERREFFFYFVFKIKFNYEPTANPNIVSNILFNANRNEKFW